MCNSICIVFVLSTVQFLCSFRRVGLGESKALVSMFILLRKLYQMTKIFRKNTAHMTYFLHITNMKKLVISNDNHRAIGNHRLSIFKFDTLL